MIVRAKVHVLGMTPGQERDVDGRARRIRSLIAAGWLEPVAPAQPEAATPPVVHPEPPEAHASGEPDPGSGSGE